MSTTDRIEQAARDCWSHMPAISTEKDASGCIAAIAALVRREVERERATPALASALRTWDERAFNALLALPHGAIVAQELRAIRARGEA